MKIFFSAGEPSGDQHAAHLIGELRRLRPDVECTGYGGPLMERAGCRLDHRLTDLAVMGFLRVVPLLRTFYRLVRQAGRRFAESPPDAVVLVDFPGFNWWIARKAKAAGIPVFYYLPPQLWAWAGWRVKRVRRYVDHVLCGLPFEPDWYAKRGVRAEYVGHPFFDEVADSPLDAEFVRQWSPTGHVGGACRVGCAHQGETPSHGSDGGHSPLDSSQRTIGILPGSRRHEVEHNWPTMIEVMRRLALRHPDVRFLVACYKPEFERRCRELLANCRAECHAVLPSGGGSGTPTDAGRSGTPSCEPGTLPVHFFVGRTPEIIEAAECCLMVSGSVSLEMLARETPAAVLYHVAPALYPLLRLLVHVDSITLPNLIAGRRVLPEWVVALSRRRAIDECTATLDRWLSDSSELARVRNELASLRNEFGRVGATVRTAEYILNHSPVARLRRAA
ncbi:MAG TPA: lipid-A-disaccharide synthase [Planctomycetaceae bacterium]|nr:lipid-A-disaccharide synthase [Planctomycetaceae bacterium]